MRGLPLLALVACGFVTPEMGPTPYAYEVDCFRVAAEVPLSEDILFEDMRRAHEVLDEAVSPICDQPMRDIKVGSELMRFAEGLSGYSDPPGGAMYLTRNLRSLVHEVLHGIEWARGIYDTDNHPDWEAKGFLRLNLDFAPYVLDAAL